MSYLLSIDPGISNLGITLFDPDKNSIIHATKLSIVERVKLLKSEREYVDRLHKIFTDPEFKSLFLKNTKIVLIEVQMRRAMIIVQHVIATIVTCLGLPFEFISPISVKNWFRGKKTTKRMGHKHNKKEAIRVFEKLFPGYTISSQKKDDIADSVLQAAYYKYKLDYPLIKNKK